MSRVNKFDDSQLIEDDYSQVPPDDSEGVVNTDGSEAVQLTPDEMEDFAQAETCIREGLVTFFNVGRALELIRANKWYRARGYQNFESYCTDCWGVTRRRAYQLIEAATAMANLVLEHQKVCTTVHTSPLMLSERAMRPLLKIENEAQRYQAFEEAVNAAREAGKPAPTSTETTAAVQKVLAPVASGAIAAAPVAGAIAVASVAESNEASMPPAPPALRTVTPSNPAPPRDAPARTEVKVFGPRYQYWGSHQFDGDTFKTEFEISGQMRDGELLFQIDMDGLDFSHHPPATLTKCRQWLEEAIAAEDLRRSAMRRAA